MLAIVILQNIPNQIVFMRLLSTSTRNLEKHLRTALCRRLQHLSIGYYARTRTGALQSKLLRDVESIQQLLMGVFEPVLMFSAAAVAAIVVTALRVPVFLLLYALTVPLAVLVVTTLRRPIQERNAELRRQIEQMSSSLTEMTELLPITRAHGEEQHELARVERRLDEVQAAGLRLDWITAVFGSTAWVLLQLFGALTLGVAAFLFTTQWVRISLGDVVLLTGYFTALVGAVLGLLNLVPQVSRGFEALRSVGEILECPDLEQNEGKLAVAEVRGHFVFDHVGHRYPGAAEAALQDVVLEVSAGRDDRVRGAFGRRQVDAARDGDRLPAAERGSHPARRARHGDARPADLSPLPLGRAAGHDPVRRLASSRTSPTAAGRSTRLAHGARSKTRRPSSSWSVCRTDGRRWWASGARGSRADRSSGSRSRALSSATRACWCWTRRPRRSTRSRSR